MADIHIERKHELGLKGARKLAWQWAEQAEEEFDMSCTYEEGKDADEVQFSRSGVSGCLRVSGDQFVLDAKLGFLLGAFKDRIESEIVKNLDTLLAAGKPAAKKAAAKKRAA
ncbi:polyhydroxyalkanoic acid system family protein [Hydrogenophaga sp. XSHU_21]